MEIQLLIAYVSTILVFMLIPGPSHILMLSISLKNGFNHSIFTMIGDLSANVIQMTLASVAIASAVQYSTDIFNTVKWAGVLYLVYLGLKLLIQSNDKVVNDLTPLESEKDSRKVLFFRGFFTSASNPKAIIFFTALFPQFINANNPLLIQFLVLTITYILIDGLFLISYGKLADRISVKMPSLTNAAVFRVCGLLYILTAILLGFKGV